MKQKMSIVWSALVVVGCIVLVAFVGPALTEHMNASNSGNYTGSAVVVSHNTGGKKCRVEIRKEDGTTNSMIYGQTMSCTNVQDGMKLDIVNGQIQK